MTSTKTHIFWPKLCASQAARGPSRLPFESHRDSSFEPSVTSISAYYAFRMLMFASATASTAPISVVLFLLLLLVLLLLLLPVITMMIIAITAYYLAMSLYTMTGDAGLADKLRAACAACS